MTVPRSVLGVVFVFVLIFSSASVAALREDLPATLARSLEQTGDTMRLGAVTVPTEPLKAFYRNRQHSPVWIEGEGLNGRAQSFLEVLAESSSHGLNPGDYRPAETASGTADPKALVAAELGLSAALVRYADDLRAGRIAPGSVDGDYFIPRAAPDPLEALALAAQSPELGSVLSGLAPRHPMYLGLKEALSRYRALAAAGGWGTLKEGPPLRPGEEDERTPRLREMLSTTGDYGGGLSPSPYFDPGLAEAVRTFQGRHGLEPDGIVGERTRTALNVPAEQRVRQILLNMERWRWLPDDLGERYVLVNMVGFQLDVFEREHRVMGMRIVAGQPDRQTPAFSDRIRYIEFNPYWSVPRKIAVEDILPKARRNPEFLAQQGIRVFHSADGVSQQVSPWAVDWSSVSKGGFPYHFRQDPGPKNALGRIKFMFPNRFAVYLHDTPKPGLFQRAQRAFSSGCIRIEKPVDLATYLLRDNDGWTTERISKTIGGGKNRSVNLATPVPVYLVYLTAWVDDAGQARFQDDLYARDPALMQALFANER